ncbi:MAG TPA: ABC transporter permease [Candidatus Saccharimonadia bacterium]|nr:ABC transporter permease [Candidatus Saccharimonadia bacterium]
MIGYYFWLAARSLRRNAILTALMILAIALGIGASMTSLTVLRAMSGNPLPHKDELVRRPQLDNWAPARGWNQNDPNDLPNLFTYQDAKALYDAQKGKRQAAMFPNVLSVEPANREVKPYMGTVLFTHGDFFPMFDIPFVHGGGWSKAQDDGNARVAVLQRETAEKLFGAENPVGRTVRLGGEDFTVAGVIEKWNPRPHFYETSSGAFQNAEEIFLPFNLGIERELTSSANNNCWEDPGQGYKAWLASDCVWISYWVELASARDAAEYKAFIDSYVQDQKKLGRFPRPLNNRLNTISEWLEGQGAVSRDVKTQAWMSAAFLLVCLINTIGLLLAKFMARAGEIGLRRAVGASKRQIFAQYLTEAGVVGVAGAIVGLVVTGLGLLALRALYGDDSGAGMLARLDAPMVAITALVAIAASLAAGLYPTWRTCEIAPATQLKSN